MIKAIILDGYSPKEVVVKFGKNYECEIRGRGY